MPERFNLHNLDNLVPELRSDLANAMRAAATGDRALVLGALSQAISRNADLANEYRARAEAQSRMLSQRAQIYIFDRDYDAAIADFGAALRMITVDREDDARDVRRAIWAAAGRRIRTIGDLEPARRFLADMRASHGRASILAWTTLLSLADTYADGRAVLDEMRAANEKPDVVTWNTLLNLADTYADGRVVLDEMRAANEKPDVVTWTTLLNLADTYADGRVVLDEMRAANEKPNVVTWNTLLNLADTYADGRVVLDEMRAANEKPNVVTWNTLLNLADTYADGRVVLDEMRAANEKPDVVTWTTLLNLAATYTDGRAVLDEMRAANEKPNVVTWNTLLNLADTYAAGRDVLNEMRTTALTDRSVQPNERTATALIAKLRSIDEANALLADLMSLKLVGPGAFGAFVTRIHPMMTGDELLDWCFRAVQGRGFGFPFSALEPGITGYIAARRYDDALRIIMPFPYLPASIKFLRSSKYRPIAEAYFRAQFEAGREPHHAAYAMMKLDQAQGHPTQMYRWAAIALDQPKQPTKRIDELRALLENRAAPSNT